MLLDKISTIIQKIFLAGLNDFVFHLADQSTLANLFQSMKSTLQINVN